MNDLLPTDIGFLGNADIDEDIIEVQLDKWLPDQVNLYIPDRKGRKDRPGLQKIADWLRSVFEDSDIRESTDVLTDLANSGGRKALIVMYGDDDPERQEILRETGSLQIPVHDLFRALYVIDPPEEPQEEEEPLGTAMQLAPEPIVTAVNLAENIAILLMDLARQVVREELAAQLPQSLTPRQAAGELTRMGEEIEALATGKNYSYLISPEGRYRLRGRFHKGDKAINLTEEQIRNLEDQGLIDGLTGLE